MTQVAPKVEQEQFTRLMDLMNRATPDQKKLMREAMGVKDGTVNRKKRRGSNQDARLTMRQYGEAVHGPEFRVAPPQAISDRGPLAVAAWMEKRENNQEITDAELDSMVASAKE